MADMTPEPSISEAGSPGARRPIGSYSSYEEAQRVVDFLSDRDFPVERVSIVGRDLEYVEQVTGRMTTGRAALQGAGQGALLGLLFALFIGIFFTVAGAYFAVLLYGLIVGAILGALFGAIGQAATGGQRDFSAVGAMRANRYDVLVDHDAADDAARLLTEMTASVDMPSEPAQTPNPSTAATPSPEAGSSDPGVASSEAPATGDPGAPGARRTP